jgi:hypothetical protein
VGDEASDVTELELGGAGTTRATQEQGKNFGDKAMGLR